MSENPTTTRRQPSGPASITAEGLTPAQRLALNLADAHGWGIVAEARDGSRLQLRRGHPARALVIYLGDPAQGFFEGQKTAKTRPARAPGRRSPGAAAPISSTPATTATTRAPDKGDTPRARVRCNTEFSEAHKIVSTDYTEGEGAC